MYCRVVNVKALSELQMKMIVAYIETTMLPRNLGAGQISGEVFSISAAEVFAVSRFNDKATADKIMSLMKEELKEIAKGSKMTVLEGPLLIEG
ncbi:MAG: hypothetical protein CMD82_06005 [Gammaproteobacteria bacterium]|jgi:hypothetical protein|nr:hypothetical protein [Gammaproteobacteria bacterium]|tara:strand:+ start:13377 stop:13655 length:279 start_codon:yes stop_codon:yes gene_type:complete